MSKEINYFIFTVGRSGHHAIINWIAEQFPGSITHKNAIRKWTDQNFKGGTTHRYKNEGDKIGNIYNFEDFDPKLFQENNFNDFPAMKDATSYIIFVFRDPFNWFASRQKLFIKRDRLNDPVFLKHLKELMEIYKKQIREFKKETNYINLPIIDINFNRWFEKKPYREEIANKLQLPFSDKGLNVMSWHGDGSSFTALQYQNKATKMKVLTRWEHFKDDKFYREWINDPDLIKFSEEYFNFNPFK